MMTVKPGLGPQGLHEAQAPNAQEPCTQGPLAQVPSAQEPKRAPLKALVAGQLGLHATMAGLRMATPLLALSEGYSAWTVGILIALFAAAPVASAMPAGRLADRKGYHPMVWSCVGIAVLGAALAALCTWFQGPAHFALLCASAVFSGMAANTGVLTIQRAAGLAATSDADRVRVFSLLGLAPPIANVLGPVTVGMAIDAWGYRAGFFWLMALPLMALVSMNRVPHGVGKSKHSALARRGAWVGLLRAPGLLRLLAVNWVLSMAWDVHTFAVPILGFERGYNATTVGLILGSFTAAVAGVRLLIPLVVERVTAVQVMRAAMLSTALICAVYPLAPNAASLIVLAALLGFSLGSVQPMVMSLVHQLTPDQRYGEALALRSMLMNASSTLMPLLFGVAGTATGSSLLFWIMAGLLGLSCGLPKGLQPWLRTNSPMAKTP